MNIVYVFQEKKVIVWVLLIQKLFLSEKFKVKQAELSASLSLVPHMTIQIVDLDITIFELVIIS